VGGPLGLFGVVGVIWVGSYFRKKGGKEGGKGRRRKEGNPRVDGHFFLKKRETGVLGTFRGGPRLNPGFIWFP